MTDRKKRILDTALELFAMEGYAATSTSRIAKIAGVSEGLIFRHFESKKGLLNALIEDAEARAIELQSRIIQETDARIVIRKAISLPFQADEKKYEYWRLQFKLKWDNNYRNPDHMNPLVEKLTQAFADLNYEDPEKEALTLTLLVESIAMSIARNGLKDQLPLEAFLLKKYKV